MLNGVIIEDDVLKVKGVVSLEEIPSILSLINEDVQTVRRYVEPLEPFLAIVLTERCPAKIQGLKQKYPLAFTNWEVLPYRNARVFTWGTLEQEQTSRIAYALLHYAAQNEALNTDLKQLFRKEFPELEQYCKELEPGHALEVLEVLHLSRQIVKIEEGVSPMALVNAYAVVDYFVSLHGFIYDYETNQSEVLDTLAYLQRVVALLLLEYSPKGYNTMIDRVDEKCLKRLKAETKPYIQAYEAKIGVDLVKYCRKITVEYTDRTLSKGYQVAIYRQFGQDIRSLMKTYPMTLTDIEQLVYILLESARAEQGLTKHPEVEVFCEYLEKRFVSAMIDYTHAKAFAMDRQFFFKTQGFSDAQMLQALQNEVKQANQQVAQLTQMVAGFEEEKLKLKELYTKQFSQQIKASNEELVLVNQENRKLQKELAEMQEALDLAKQQIAEAEEFSLVVSEVSEESWEAKQARWIEQLNRPEILIVGCHPRTVHRLKAMLPQVKYYELDTNIQDHYLVGVEQIFICLHQVNHAMTFKLDRCCGNVPRHPIRKTNAQLILQELAQTLGID